MVSTVSIVSVVDSGISAIRGVVVWNDAAASVAGDATSAGISVVTVESSMVVVGMIVRVVVSTGLVDVSSSVLEDDATSGAWGALTC